MIMANTMLYQFSPDEKNPRPFTAGNIADVCHRVFTAAFKSLGWYPGRQVGAEKIVVPLFLFMVLPAAGGAALLLLENPFRTVLFFRFYKE